MYQDILDGPSRKVAYRIYGWLQIIAGALAIYTVTAWDSTPKWVTAVLAVLTFIGSQFNFTSADNTLPAGLTVKQLKQGASYRNGNVNP